ncbi:hypothetical protein AB4Y40_19640 [Paraburkholderia sp. EG287B]|uniref:hypothetical protein n=1 Tax=Paraburkholderia sp. EG287B TaxID=3237010 RepID=UPI0034D239E0
MKLLQEGNLAQPLRDLCIVLGLALIWGSAFFIKDLANPLLWICVSIGTLLGGVGGACHLASKAGIKPFDNSYKKARDSYTAKDDRQEWRE